MNADTFICCKNDELYPIPTFDHVLSICGTVRANAPNENFNGM